LLTSYKKNYKKTLSIYIYSGFLLLLFYLKKKALKKRFKNMYKKSFKHFKRLEKIYHILYIYIMSEDLNDFFITDFDNWNYN
jgi:hypothetical protein